VSAGEREAHGRQFMTLYYQTPPDPPPKNHNAIYTSLLGAVAFLFLLGIGSSVMQMHMPKTPPVVRMVFEFMIFVGAGYLAVIIAVLLIRIFFPAYARWPTFALNITLLIYFPFGTALAIYGFLKVDKPPIRYLPPPLQPNL
jgi:hypothetical protein